MISNAVCVRSSWDAGAADWPSAEAANAAAPVIAVAIAGFIVCAP